MIDFSAWMQGFITDYSTVRPWGQASSPVGGHSLSLFKRTYVHPANPKLDRHVTS
jgi:hypothetical protein